MDEKPKDLWEDTDSSKYQMHVTISTIDSTIKPENVDESVVYIEDLEKRKQAYGICGECKEPDFLNEIKSHLQIYLVDIVQCYGITQDPNNKDRLLNFKNLPKPVNSSDLSSFQFSSDTNYTAQSTSTNPISECLDVQLSELELNEICQDSEHNIE
ncbi:unnamed protein product [Rhizophagus irregularis]|uniref:Uncharacterized protein n=1 Tax=Rhizophagus irregularis TaxID=588596 RepID=A0A916E2B1_9GLOM|nr:unnamed protein product [Rhizophagus irregularis]